jgi:hypothetical protein
MRAVPMAVIVRQLGHADTRMTEKHYAHLAPNYVADTNREGFPRLAHEESVVVPINPRRGAEGRWFESSRGRHSKITVPYGQIAQKLSDVDQGLAL